MTQNGIRHVAHPSAPGTNLLPQEEDTIIIIRLRRRIINCFIVVTFGPESIYQPSDSARGPFRLLPALRLPLE